MRFRNTTLTLASAALAALALATLPAMAEKVTLNVPFDFTVNGHDCPAGSYSVQRDTRGDFVRLQNKDASQSFTWIASTGADSNLDSVILKFDARGQEHSLRSVQYGPVVTNRIDKKTWKTEDISAQRMPGQ